jgi:GNAT superfamily N-acetyltransferase
MKRLYRKLVFQYSEGGFGRIMQKSVLLVRRMLYSEDQWNIYVHRASDAVDPGAAPMKCRALTYAGLIDAKYFKALAFPEEIRNRFDHNNICHGFYFEEDLATIGWSSNDYLELDHGVTFSCPTEVGLFDFTTLPDFRSRGLYTNALRYLVRDIHARGTRGVYIAVDPNNLPSVKGIQRAGFAPFLIIKRRRIFGVVFQVQRSLRSNCIGQERKAS